MSLFIFAAARDGDMLLSSVQAKNLEVATVAALMVAKDHHGLTCPYDEIEGQLDGFTIQPASGFGLAEIRSAETN